MISILPNRYLTVPHGSLLGDVQGYVNVCYTLDMSDVTPQTRQLLLAVRQAILICLGAIETYLGMERSVTPKHRLENKT